MTSPPHRALQEALRVLAETVTDRRWEMAVDAGVAARAAVQAMELRAEFWFGSDEEESVAAAAASAVHAGEMDVAARLLDITRTEADDPASVHDKLVSARGAVGALRRNDPELALATLLVAPLVSGHAKVLGYSLAQKTAEMLDQGRREQRMLGVLAVEIDRESGAEARRKDWATSRNLSTDHDTLRCLAVSMCLRRRGSKDSLVFEACAAKVGQDLFAVAPSLFEQAAVCARRCLDAGAYSRSTFTMFAKAAVQSGREAELAELSAAIATRHPSRGALMAEIVERVRRPTSSWPPPSTPRVLRAPAPVVAEALGTFEIDSGLLTVGDPGYTDDCLRFHVPIVGVKTGTWRGTVLRANVPGRGERCAMLIAEHESHSCSVDDPVWVPQGSLDIEYAVAGIFDSTRYYDGVVDADLVAEALHPSMVDEHPWYVACVRRSHGVGEAHDDRGAGVLPFGCVSASGLGDGAYQCYAVRAADGAIVGVCIDFDLRAVEDDA